MKTATSLVACLALLALLAPAFGCSDEPSPVSSDMSSRDIAITVTVEGTPERTRVSGYFSAPSSNVRLVEGDSLVVVTSEVTRNLALASGKFDKNLAPYGGPLLVRFGRPEGRGGNVDVRTRIAPPFALREPTAARASLPVTVTWEAGTGRDFATTLTIAGPCITRQSRDLDLDTGAYTFNAGELEKKGTAARCEVTATVVKKFGTATQTASRIFAITP